ncbi:MAG: hypothetical protein WCA20_26710, partial [Candidatus Sulfotelmatobacter sp.]
AIVGTFVETMPLRAIESDDVLKRGPVMDEEQLVARMTVLESRQRHTFQVAGILAIVLASALILQWRQIRHLQNPQKLRVRELAVVDERGTERILIAAPLPDPMILGKRGTRGGGTLSGIIIADSTGTERGGYATGDGYANAILTLDGQGHQTVLLLAEPDGSTMFRIWNGDKGSVTMGVQDNPFLNLKQNGKPLFLAPLDNPESRDPRPLFK